MSQVIMNLKASWFCFFHRYFHERHLFVFAHFTMACIQTTGFTTRGNLNPYSHALKIVVHKAEQWDSDAVSGCREGRGTDEFIARTIRQLTEKLCLLGISRTARFRLLSFT